MGATVIVLAGVLVHGRPMTMPAAGLAASATALAAFVFLGESAPAAVSVLSGPGAHSVVVLSRTAWVLYAVASLALLAASLTHDVRATPGQKRRWAGPIIGLVVALVVTLFGVATGSGTGADAAQAEPIAIPAIPTSLGQNVAYRLRSALSQRVVPAGPGFVTVDEEAVTAYDGATGRKRWRFSTDGLSEECFPYSAWSTGTDAESVVIVQCADDDEYTPAALDEQSDAGLTAFDAMTGRHLWTNSEGWAIRARAVSDGDGAVGVVRGEGTDARIGALNIRTGHVRWSRPVRECADLWSATTVTSSVVVLELCPGPKDVSAVSFDMETGTPQRIRVDLSRWAGVDAAIMWDVLAVMGSRIAVRYTLDRGRHNEALAIVDTATATARVDWGQVDWLHLSPEEGLIPGDVAELMAHPGDDFTDVLTMPAGERRRIDGLEAWTSWSSPALNLARWATVGEELMTATEFAVDGLYRLVTVHPDNSISRRPSPCGRRPGGITPVPGAVLMLCRRSDNDDSSGVEIIALR
ncbi:PQQ-binding-like beta-propeller repeat protein [Gordonia sp. NPDC062954]|uniref:PQQ-binding-like beta-propeller repeat protein n=1 Tax=Gordonia aquimaris TaxID=2984863 RepID=A0A9X3I3K2_9ACTN|nr:PQQ-binding-like beta-propeller repeat protein [Gordonia aquimaris]MCX2963251.1 PQQ-binding-like beta-propeller repeat protein [Gordonia aquimaris]